jgi:hypothetical protein
MSDKSKSIVIRKCVDPVHTKIINKETLKKGIESLYDIYNRSVILKFTGNCIGVDPIISALGEKLRSIEHKRMINLLDNLDKKIKLMDKTKIDYDFTNSEEFTELVFKVFNNVRRDHREEKIKYYANILINYSTKEFSHDFYKEYILNRVSDYTEEHILLLDEVYKKHLEINDRDKPDFDNEDLPLDNLTRQNTDICVNTLILDGFLTRAFWGDKYFINELGIKCINLIKEIH